MITGRTGPWRSTLCAIFCHLHCWCRPDLAIAGGSYRAGLQFLNLGDAQRKKIEFMRKDTGGVAPDVLAALPAPRRRAFEAALLRRGVRFPFGGSILATAVKGGDGRD